MAFDGGWDGGPDATAPTVEVQSPTVPSGFPASYRTAKDTAVVLRVLDALPGAVVITVVAHFIGGGIELAYFDGAFQGDYVARSSRVTIEDGFDLSIRRGAGWPGSGTVGDVTLEVEVVDGSGNRVHESFAWSLPPEVEEPAAEPDPAPAAGTVAHVAAALARVPSQFRI